MTINRRQMALTVDLVARAGRVPQDSGPPPGAVYMTDDDYAVVLRDVLAGAPDGDIWFFAYGSLLWKPACEVDETRKAQVRGWHRRFCIKMNRGRGTPERPGLMMALDRGGRCQGVICRVPPDRVEGSIDALLRREVLLKPSSNAPRWLTVETGGSKIRALCFVINRQSPNYTGSLSLDHVAEVLATAVGHFGSGAEYLYSTVSHLEERGIHDRNLWRLQALVAQRLLACPVQEYRQTPNTGIVSGVAAENA
jgi:glutathione-specific gamma-glutamylcyclotransferase